MKYDDDGWLEFLQKQMFFSLVCGILFGVVALGSELLHSVTGGRVPSLIECLVKWETKQKAPIIINDDDDNEDEEDEGLPESARPPFYVIP